MARLRVELASDADANAWNEFVEEHNGSVYHLYEWRRVLEEGCGYKCYYLMAYESGELRAVFPLATLGRLLVRGLSSLPMSDYGGPILAEPERGAEVLDALLKVAYGLSGGRGLEVRSPRQPQVRRYMKSRASAAFRRYVSFLIELAPSFDYMWRDVFNKELRKKIKKAQKHDIEVEVGEFGSLAHPFYRLYLMSMRRLGSPPHAFRFFEECRKALGDRRVKIFLARKEGRPIAALFVLLHGLTIYPAYEGSDAAYRDLNPVSLLYSEVIRWGCEHGFRLLDFGRTLYGSGVFVFKRKWRGKQKQRVRLVRQPYYYLWRKRAIQDPRDRFTFLPKLWRTFVKGQIALLIGPILKIEFGY